MLTKTRRTMVACAIIILLAGHGLCQTPSDVPKDHWAYSAVEDLASKGLIKGYPPEGNFFGKRTVTRYEMATILQRVLARVDELLAAKANKEDVKPATASVSPEQLEEVRRLVEEFKTELMVIGTDLAQVKQEIGAINTRIDLHGGQIEQNTTDIAANKQGIQSAIDAIKEQTGRVDTLSKTVRSHRISGYFQARFESFDQGRTSLFTPTGAGGTGQVPANGGPDVGGPYYGFVIRRARVALSGSITDHTDYYIEPDFPSYQALNLKQAYATIHEGGTRRFSVTAGQFNLPFGYDLSVSSSAIESPEPALAFSNTTLSSPIFKTAQSATGGVITPGSVQPLMLNQKYDQGLLLTYLPRPSDPSTRFDLAAINGEGTIPGGIRNLNNGIDVMGRARTAFHKVEIGLSGYYGTLPVRAAQTPHNGVPGPFANALRELGDAYVVYTAPWGTYFRAEYIGGVFEASPDRSYLLPNNHVQGYYFLARHPLTHKLDLVAKYEEYMPISQEGKTAGGLSRMQLIRRIVHIGGLYQLDSATRLRLWYMRGLTPYDPSASSGPLRDRLGEIFGEVQVVY